MGQVMNKLKKGEPTPQQVEKLAVDLSPIIDEVYKNANLENKDVTVDDLYHAIFEIVQKLRGKNGAMQYKLNSKDDLETIYNKYKNGTGKLTKDRFEKIFSEAIKLENISVGQGAMDILLYLFGIPICAVMAKRAIPSMRSVSDDVVIPLATSGSVIFLVKTHKL